MKKKSFEKKLKNQSLKKKSFVKKYFVMKKKVEVKIFCNEKKSWGKNILRWKKNCNEKN